MTLPKLKVSLTAALAVLSARLGSLAAPLYTLAALNLADYLSALLAARHRGQAISSRRGMQGISKKVLCYVLVWVGARMDWLLVYSAAELGFSIATPPVLATLVCVWLVVNEMLSVLENVADAGVPLPPFLLPLVRLLKSRVEETKVGEGE